MKFTRKQLKQIFDEIEALESYRAQIYFICKTFKRNFPNVLKSKKFLDLLTYIENNTRFADDTCKISTKIWFVLHGFKYIPKCETCGKILNKKNVKNVFSTYPRFCNNACMNKSQDHILHCQTTTLKNYGVKTPLQNIELHKKAQNTYFKKTGFKFPGQNPDVKLKARNTYKKKTGYEHIFENPIFKKQRNETWLKKYNTTNPNKCENIKEKISQTCLKKYGVRNVFQSDKFRKYSRKTYQYDNFTFASKPEICFYIWLKDNNIKFEFQPKTNFIYVFQEKLHTYTADFYLIDTNEYIDLKGDQFFKNDGTMQNPWNHDEDELYEAKHQCMLKNNVKIFLSSQYEKFLKYVDFKYGKNFLEKFTKTV